jgi:hypothetical protein
MFTHRAHACEPVQARVWLKHSLIFGRILFKFARHIQQITTSYMGYILIMFTHVCARVINCSLIYGRFLLKFPVNILDITASSKGDVLNMSERRVHACERVCSSMCVQARVRARA